MTSRRYFRIGDQPKGRGDQSPPEGLDIAPLVGTWVNTKKDTGGFVRLAIAEREGRLFLRAFAADTPELCDWGEVEAFAYANNVASHKAVALSAFLDAGFAEVAFQGNLNLGLLVLVTFNRFKHDGERANYINREFFYRLKSSPAGA
ncbi:MAG: hypothetical protein JOZ96_19435 [Acidobacteria bacterium]|nr:hypothetical protein [Acidobacteriota bacterium]